MKRNLLYLICSIATPLLYSSCYVDLDLEPQRPNTSIVVNSIISTDQNAAAHIGKTVFYTDRYRPASPIQNTTVEITVNQGTPQRLKEVANEEDDRKNNVLFLSEYMAKTGDRIRLDVTAENGDHVWAEDVMPQKTLIEKVDTTIGAGTDQYSRAINYHITFTDNPNEKNYYFLHVLPTNGRINNDIEFGKEDVFRQNNSALDLLSDEVILDGRYGMAFSDELINGKTYTLRVSEIAYASTFDYRADRTIRLYSITESYYRYLLGIFNKKTDGYDEEMVNAGLAEPSPHYTNIQGGVGILGLMQIDEKTINVGSDEELYWY